MSDTLSTFILVLALLTFFNPERSGRYAHETTNAFMRGWEQVKQ
jgi:hypothetical protein